LKLICIISCPSLLFANPLAAAGLLPGPDPGGGEQAKGNQTVLVVVFAVCLAETSRIRAGTAAHPAIFPEPFIKNSAVDSLATWASPCPTVLVRGFLKESIVSSKDKNMSCYAQF
jgi:hypothetical protein